MVVRGKQKIEVNVNPKEIIKCLIFDMVGPSDSVVKTLEVVLKHLKKNKNLSQ